VLEPSQQLAIGADIRRVLQQQLGPTIITALDDLDSKLFELASSARSGADEQRLLEGLRELRRQRTGVENGFVARIGQSLIYLAQPDRRRSPASPLSLYGRDDLEERLALTSVAAPVAKRLHELMNGLNHRLAALAGRPAYDDQTNPIGPQALAEAFRDAFQALDVSLDIRLLAYRKLPLHLFVGLEACYRRCNALLIGAGLLPELPQAAKEAAPVEPPAKLDAIKESPPPEAYSAEVPARPSSSPAVAADGANLGNLFELLLERSRHRHRRPSDPQAKLGQWELSRSRLLDVTNDLLKSTRDAPAELKRSLLELAQRQSPAQVSLSPADEGAIELVEAVFNRMRRDEVLPTPLGSALAELQLPFLNAVLRDQTLLNDPAHPARRLIDEFSDTARGWSLRADPGQHLLRQMQAVQSVLKQEGEQEGAGFSRALAEFREFATSQKRLAEQAEQRAIESTRSREALRQAQSDARLHIDLHIGNFTPSPWLRQLLTQHWMAYLVLVLMRHGVVSELFRQALAFADSLLIGERDAANPIHAASFRARRVELETQLRQGLATLAYPDEDIQRLCRELTTFILVGVTQGRSVGEAAPSVEDNDVVLQDQPRPDSHDPSVMRHLRGLRPGAWFELGEPAEDAERGRLSWISPSSGRWVLVNWAGRKVMDVPPEQMANDIARGLARVIGDAQVLRRAVEEVMAELQPPAAHPPESHAEA